MREISEHNAVVVPEKNSNEDDVDISHLGELDGIDPQKLFVIQDTQLRKTLPRKTGSLCPECSRPIPADLFEEDGKLMITTTGFKILNLWPHLLTNGFPATLSCFIFTYN